MSVMTAAPGGLSPTKGDGAPSQRTSRADITFLTSYRSYTLRELLSGPEVPPAIRLRASLAILGAADPMKAETIGADDEGRSPGRAVPEGSLGLPQRQLTPMASPRSSSRRPSPSPPKAPIASLSRPGSAAMIEPSTRYWRASDGLGERPRLAQIGQFLRGQVVERPSLALKAGLKPQRDFVKLGRVDPPGDLDQLGRGHVGELLPAAIKLRFEAEHDLQHLGVGF
jgi:hypothetical protein